MEMHGGDLKVVFLSATGAVSVLAIPPATHIPVQNSTSLGQIFGSSGEDDRVD